ncbi:hypothetical protein BJY24_003288 [Nocardia transvalensis]|uniref:Uncharacterized protein n=1 Tax=Nocardia transvalensis TaxID=37333 RepID=A0A7W9PEC0_9NOCA|nr:hypothetical protein [Nocardia transvalensis]MBB5914421.1 hypothetical protein [Nocardia transvalensis]
MITIGSKAGTLPAADPPPDQSKTGHLRYRLNKLLFADLRYSYGQ